MMTEEEFTQANKNFDEQMKIAKENPELFEKMRLEAIQRFLDGVEDPEKRKRLEKLQWRIDQVRRKNKNPLSASMAVSEMMWAGFRELNELWKEARALIHKTNNTIEEINSDLNASLEEVKNPDQVKVVSLKPQKKEKPTNPDDDDGPQAA